MLNNPKHNCICCQSEKAEPITIVILGENATQYLCDKHLKQFANGEISESNLLYCINNRNAGKYFVFIK